MMCLYIIISTIYFFFELDRLRLFNRDRENSESDFLLGLLIIIEILGSCPGLNAYMRSLLF